MKKKANKNRKKSDSSNMKGWLKDIGLFVVGTLFGLCVVNWFVKLLPGPQQDLRVAETGGAAENKGCMYYSVLLTSREPIEYTYAKILLPNTITAQEFAVFDPLIEQAKISRFTIFRGGKDQNGKCIINSAEKNDNHTAIGEIPDDPVHAYFSGSILKINAFKLPTLNRQTSFQSQQFLLKGTTNILNLDKT
ncbi:MAG: hypothetical protein GY799_07755 [Desulfobulbaceae bacterium]|nr:hypothetical protein [Desulfobulbaceae bacterium]